VFLKTFLEILYSFDRKNSHLQDAARIFENGPFPVKLQGIQITPFHVFHKKSKKKNSKMEKRVISTRS
jgi:hypothetical protein